MKQRNWKLCAVGMVAACVGVARAQSNVDATRKFAWSENCGWTNWRDAGSPAGSEGAAIGSGYLAGAVWCENLGFLNLGNVAPANGTDYANLNGADFGVNVLADRRLGGLAWGENVGWVSFGPFAGLPAAEQAWLDAALGRLRGYAWGENIGWVNLDEEDHAVAIHCRGDFNEDGSIDFFDYLDFVDAFSGNDAHADLNLDGSIDFFDYLDFVDAFSAGC